MDSRKDNHLEPIKVNKTEKLQKIDRVVLDAESVRIVQEMSDFIHSKLGNVMQISQKDIVNFLIQNRAPTLAEKELELLKSEHFDIVRALKVATAEAIKSKQKGKEICVDDIFKIIQTPSVT